MDEFGKAELTANLSMTPQPKTEGETYLVIVEEDAVAEVWAICGTREGAEAIQESTRDSEIYVPISLLAQSQKEAGELRGLLTEAFAYLKRATVINTPEEQLGWWAERTEQALASLTRKEQWCECTETPLPPLNGSLCSECGKERQL